MKKCLVVFFLVCSLPFHSASAKLAVKSANPYLGALVMDADTGKVIFEDNADVVAYPASVLKLMDLLVILEKIDEGVVKLDDMITVDAETSKIGGSQVYQAEKEVFSVEDLLYALMVQSANDAATALAIHIGGSKEGFVQLMNEKAQQLGMKSTVFHSIHGLPPGPGQEPDVTTPRDLSLLCLALLKHPQTLKYTSVIERPFRTSAKEPFIMRNHNHLLSSYTGCDGLKTGFYSAAGYSIAATAQRNGVRVLAIVMGSINRKTRDAKTAELLGKGFMAIPRKSQPVEKKAAPVAKPARIGAGVGFFEAPTPTP